MLAASATNITPTLEPSPTGDSQYHVGSARSWWSHLSNYDGPTKIQTDSLTIRLRQYLATSYAGDKSTTQ